MKKSATEWLFILSITGFFLLFILIPTLYVMIYALQHLGTINSFVLSDPVMLGQIKSAIIFSLGVSLLATLVDIILAIPVAWFLVRYKYSWISFVDTLVDVPMVMPTAALGLSVTMFWCFEFFKFGSPFLLIFMVLTAFSLPYMIRTLVAIIAEIDITYELAGRSLGAARLTVFRTVSLPLFKEGLITGAILCFSRCISETGAVSIALNTLKAKQMTATTVVQDMSATVLIAGYKSQGGVENLAAASFISVLLIILGATMTIVANMLVRRAKIHRVRLHTKHEKKLSTEPIAQARNITFLLLFLMFSFIPASFIITHVTKGFSLSDPQTFVSYLFSSILVAATVTGINVLLGVPMALLIGKKETAFSNYLDALIGIPIIVPTVAVGFSLGLFWTEQSFMPKLPELLLVIMAHCSITYSYVVKTVNTALFELNPEIEEASRTLGADRLRTFLNITYPLIKPAMVAGAIMSFTRSMDETGATLAVVPGKTFTIPVYIVDLVKKEKLVEAGNGCIVLIIMSYLLLLLFRFIMEKVAKRKEFKPTG